MLSSFSKLDKTGLFLFGGFGAKCGWVVEEAGNDISYIYRDLLMLLLPCSQQYLATYLKQTALCVVIRLKERRLAWRRIRINRHIFMFTADEH